MFTPEKNLLDEIVARVVAGDEAWLKDRNIDFGRKGEHWILNYGQMGPRNEHNRLTRGLVVHQPTGRVHSFPFARFFNLGEKEAEQVDFGNADVLEKLDGSMVAVFFPDRDVRRPCWQTRKMLSTTDLEFELKSFRGESFNLLREVEKFLRGLTFDPVYDADKTWVFEFISPWTRVITKYEPHQSGLYLLGARDLTLPHYPELAEDALDAAARRLGARRPRRWDVSCHDDVRAMMGNFPKDFEGFVVRERGTSRRVKIKSEDYVKVHHLLTSINFKNLIPLWLEGEEEEVVSYFPEARPKIDRIAASFGRLVDDVAGKVLFWKRRMAENGWDRKGLALALTGQVADPHAERDSTVRTIVFREFQTPEGRMREAVEKALRLQNVHTLQALMGLQDAEETTAPPDLELF